MQRAVVLANPVDEFPPGPPGEERARFEGGINQLGTLVEDASGADGVMPDFGVAHVLVAGQTDRAAVGLKLEENRRVVHQAVEVRRLRQVEGVGVVAFGPALIEPHPVED